MLNLAASAVDGGPSMLAQRATLAALEESRVEQETTALRAEFALKRKIMLDGLAELGIRPAAEPRGTFMCGPASATFPPRSTMRTPSSTPAFPARS